MLLICVASVLVCFSKASEFSLHVPDGLTSTHLGSSVILPCGLSPLLNAKTFEIRWYRNNDYDNPVLLYKDQRLQENTRDPQFSSRLSLFGELENGNASLKLENVTISDSGEYVCLVRNTMWYDTARIHLLIKALGSLPVLSFAEAGDQVNVSCASDGWSPKPTLTWRNKRGRELPYNHIHYRNDSEGLVSVRSWLMFSPSDSEWISCSVGLSDQEIKEGRVLPLKGFRRESFISTIVFLLIIIILTILLLRSHGLLPCCSCKNNTKTEDTSRAYQSRPLKEKEVV